MKAIFLNNGYQVGRVYPEEAQERLGKLVELHPDVIRQDELEDNRVALRGAEAAFSTWGMPALSEAEIEEYLPNLKIVFYGAGSVQEFARPFLLRGVRVASAWAANAVPVVQFASSAIVLGLKGFFPAHAAARTDWNSGRFACERRPGCFRSTVGLLGLGMIGRGVAQRLVAEGLRVVAYDPFAPDTLFESLGVARATTLEEAFGQSDAVSNHIANLPETQEMLRYEHFRLLPEAGFFLNTGRNAQVHVPGFLRAFTEEPARTALFDVTDPDEPPSADNPLLTLPNAYFTPHMAGATGREVQRMGEYMIEECGRFLRGEQLKWEVTLKMLETMA